MTIKRRERILAAWRNDPGVPLQTLADRTGVSLSCVYYHVVVLEKAGLITGRVHECGNRTGKYVHHMPAKKLSEVRRTAARKSRKKRDIDGERIECVVQKARPVIPAPGVPVKRKPYQTFVAMEVYDECGSNN